MGEREDPGRLPCGCIRGGIACSQAHGLLERLEAAFLRGVQTGRWVEFNKSQAKLEHHYEAVGALKIHVG